MPSQNVLHIKLEYEESISAKRGILSTEMHVLNLAKRIVRYRNLRLQEHKLRSRAYSKMKEVKANIRKLENTLPTPRIPRILKRHEQKEKEEREETKTSKNKEKKLNQPADIESQLQEIQKRLSQLQGA